MKDLLGIANPSSVFAGIGENIITGLVKGLQNKLPDLQAAIAGLVGAAQSALGGITSWLQEAMRITGVPASWLPGLQVIAAGESGGDPNAANNWDVNAQAGNPSIGLMQTTRSTFAGNALPGMTSITNPIHNAVAAIRYIQGRYGDISRVPGVASRNRGGPTCPTRRAGGSTSR